MTLSANRSRELASLLLTLFLSAGLPAASPRETAPRFSSSSVGETSHRTVGPQVTRLDAAAPPLFCLAAWSSDFEPLREPQHVAASAAGDVNGDGFADVLLGYEDHSRTIFRQGRVVLFQGSPAGLGAMPSWAFEGTLEYGRLGRTMGSAGSINADDLSDIIVGVPGYGGNQFEEGQALIFAGVANGMSARPVWTVEGDHVWRGFGVPVSGAGDVNGDVPLSVER